MTGSKSANQDNPQINFTMRVAAVRDFTLDLDEFDKREFSSRDEYEEFLSKYKIKLEIDLGSNFSPELSGAPTYKNNFDAVRFRNILNFASRLVVRKIVEQIYFDKGVGYADGKDPKGYQTVQQIYRERVDKGNMMLREKEVRAIVDEFMKAEIEDPKFDESPFAKDREKGISRFIFENFNPVQTHSDGRSKVNGDKPPL